jgi:hypothetical protein
MRGRAWILLGAMAFTVVGVSLIPTIPQSEAYHNFADQRTLLGIPNFLNVVSNVFFLFVGLWGIRFVWSGASFVDPRERWSYLVFFVGVTLTAFGSAWYHLRPDDRTLVWDRIPMTLGFMALVAAMVAERISVRLGLWLLAPLVAFGAASVIYWEYTQARGHGDLRAYALAQFGSLLVVFLLIALFPPRYTRSMDFAVALALYALAKIFEATDGPIFAMLRIVSGHTLKHLAAALSTYWILRMLRRRIATRVAGIAP